MNIAVVGTGYVGHVAGVYFADAGHDVLCVDKDENKVATMREGRSPIFEPGLEDLMKLAIKSKYLQFTADLKSAVEKNDLIFVAVGTPAGEDGNPDLTALMGVVESIAQFAN